MEGIVTAYSGTTLTFTSDLASGSGTHADWNISIAGVQGVQGPPGTAGAGTGDMIAANNLSDLTNLVAARNNLQLAAVARTGAYADLTGKPLPPTQRSVTASPISVTANDEVINCNIRPVRHPAICHRRPRARAGRLSSKMLAGNSPRILDHQLCWAKKADGLTNITLNTNYQFVRLYPMNDGSNTGWAIV